MDESKLIEIISLNGEPDNIKKIDKMEDIQLTFEINEYSITGIQLFFQNNEDFNGNIKLKIIENEYKTVIGCAEIKEIKNGWNKFKLNPVYGVYKETLTVKITFQDSDKINIGYDQFDNICVKLSYDEVEKNIGLELDKSVKELRKVYNSSGWRMLIKMYNIRDSIHNFFKCLGNIASGIIIIIRNINGANFIKAKNYAKRNGMKALILRAIDKLKGGSIQYEHWIKNHVATEAELKKQREHRFEYEPLISILIPTYKTPKHLLVETIDSVLRQSYGNWELCIADGNSQENYINEMLDEYKQKDSRIKVKYLDENKGIAGNTQECYYMSTGDYIGLFDHDDLLEPNALFENVKAINKDKTIEFLYTDEDKINEKSDYRFDPHFKQDFAIDTFRSYNYICHFSVFRKDLMAKIGGFREGFNGSQDYDIILRATEAAKNIYHIPMILYSWRVHSGSTAGNPLNKMYCYDSAKKAINDELSRNGIKGEAVDGKFIGSYEINYEIIGDPKVSIIIPSKDNSKKLDATLKSILNKTSYNNYEIVIVESNSKKEATFRYYDKIEELHKNIKVITCKEQYNYSSINNFGAKSTSGDFMLFMHDDVEVINTEWLGKMIGLAQRQDVACVGAKLYYKDNTIQHGGIILGVSGAAGYAHRNLRKYENGYFLRLGVTQNLSAVSGACLLVKRSVFDEVNGFDEGFKLKYSDIDFCLRALKLGKVNVWTPAAELYHNKNKKTKYDEKLIKEDKERFKKRYAELLEKGDPYYSPNLTLERENFSLRY